MFIRKSFRLARSSPFRLQREEHRQGSPETLARARVGACFSLRGRLAPEQRVVLLLIIFQRNQRHRRQGNDGHSLQREGSGRVGKMDLGRAPRTVLLGCDSPHGALVLQDSPRETRGGTGQEENGCSYVGLMILPHVHVHLCAVPDVIQGEELLREPPWQSAAAPPPRDPHRGTGTGTGHSDTRVAASELQQGRRELGCAALRWGDEGARCQPRWLPLSRTHPRVG